MKKDTFVKICIAIILIDLIGIVLCFCTGCNTAQITTSRALVHLSNGTDSPEFQMENTIRIERDSVYRTSQTGREFRYPRTACRMRHGVIFLTDSYNHVTEYRP